MTVSNGLTASIKRLSATLLAIFHTRLEQFSNEIEDTLALLDVFNTTRSLRSEESNRH